MKGGGVQEHESGHFAFVSVPLRIPVSQDSIFWKFSPAARSYPGSVLSGGTGIAINSTSGWPRRGGSNEHHFQLQIQRAEASSSIPGKSTVNRSM